MLRIWGILQGEFISGESISSSCFDQLLQLCHQQLNKVGNSFILKYIFTHLLLHGHAFSKYTSCGLFILQCQITASK